jgi:hypothetical protein
VKKIQILEKKLRIDPYPIKSITSSIWNVIWPFENIVFSKKMNIYLITQLYIQYEMIQDWKIYEAILFNLFQNSLFYNRTTEGDIVIALTCKPMDKKSKLNQSILKSDTIPNLKNFILETTVINSGVGIKKSKQKDLFKPFSELKHAMGQINEHKRKGVGLINSQVLSQKLGGDI